MKKRNKFNKIISKLKEQWFQHNIIAIFIAIILISGLSIGYSAFRETLTISGNAAIRIESDIRIYKIENTHNSCGFDIYDPTFTEDSIIINGKLPGLNCILEYTVSIKNNTDFVMEMGSIDDSVYNNPNIIYETDMESGIFIPANTTKEYTLTFKYKSSLSVLPSNTEIGAIFTFEFDYANIVIYESPYITDGLVLLFDGKNNSGQGYRSNINKWKDLIGNNDGLLLNNPTWSEGYLTFDGINDKVEFRGDIPSRYTIISTFYNDPAHTAAYQRIWADGPYPSFALQISGAVRNAWFYGQGKDVAFAGPIAIKGLVQVAITFNGSKVDLYVNGVYESSISTTTNPTNTPSAYLGGRGTDLLRQFKGQIYNFMIYDRVLETSEIIFNYNADTDNMIIPVITAAQLQKIGSEETVTIDNIDYKFNSTAKYIVQNNISFSHNGIWTPNLTGGGSITTNGNVITITDTSNGSTHYYRNGLYVTENSAIKDGLVLHYDGINNTGSGHSNSTNTWKDLKGNNDGTLLNNPTWDSNKLIFDGLDDKVTFVGDITNTYSMVITIKPTLDGTHPRLTSEIPFPSIYLNSNTSYKVSFYGHGLDTAFSPSRSPSASNPTYMVVTFDGNKLTMYQNGSYIGELTSVTSQESVPIAALGGRISDLLRQYKGEIYDFMIYNRALTQEEIRFSSITNSYRFNY